MQQLAWRHRSVQIELEAARADQGMLLSLPNHSLLLFSCGFHPKWSPQPKKRQKACPRLDKHQAATLTSLHIMIITMTTMIEMYLGDCERADVNKQA